MIYKLVIIKRGYETLYLLVFERLKIVIDAMTNVKKETIDLF